MSDRSSPTAPTFFPFGPQAEAWDVTFKVKYGDTLKRFYGHANGSHFDMNLSALRAKITTAFKFGPDADFILTYTDEDGDVVMLDDDDDLRDAALRQKLNPLRIAVQLKIIQPTEQKERHSTPAKSTGQDPLSQIVSAIEGLKPVQEESLAHIRSAIGEAIKSIPEPIPDALAKLSHEVLDAAPPPLAELMKPFVQLVAPINSGNGPSDVHAKAKDEPSGVSETQMPAKAKDEPNARASLGLKSVLEEASAPIDGVPQGQQSSMYPSVEELLFPNNSVDKSVCKGRIDTQSKGKSVMSSATQPAPHSVPTHIPPPPRRFQPHPWQSEDNAKSINDSRWRSKGNAKSISDSRWRIPMYDMPCAPPPRCMPPPQFIYPGRFLSPGHPYGDIAGNMENSAPRSTHLWIQCDGCGVQPVVGPRYKSNVKEDYDLCESCFQRMGNEVEYTKIDKPILPHRLPRDPHPLRKVHHPRVLMKSRREKLESRFILDVTVLDGTLMTPSTSFTKIWRMHNNGSIVWPLGTQLIWVGGDQFALHTSVPLEIPLNGFPVDKEIDVAVDFVAPTRPGRYISYWRLASPSGQKFGQRVWVHIQVEDPSFVNDNNKNAAINLNLPPESNIANTTNLIDVNVEPVDSALSANAKRTKEFHFYPIDVPELKKTQPVPCDVPSVSAAIPTNTAADVSMSTATTNTAADVPMSTATAAAFVPMPEVVPPAIPSTMPILPTTMPTMPTLPTVHILPTTMPTMPILPTVPILPTTMPISGPPAPAPPVSAPVPPPVSAVVPEPLDMDVHNEEKLLRELEEMGFRQIDLNKEILRQNNYNLEQSVDDLCGVNEWDPLLAELEEMGFDDTEMNKELLAKNGGSIKRAVMDLIAREKKDK
ncbi:hypothetical protein BS78_04G180800 [Paspalum vaginatum]|nr:hypothetical protein BS78_04G180800 [Paspalum vaginatum]